MAQRREADAALWQHARVSSPARAPDVPVIVARDIDYLPGANRFQTLTIYLPETPETSALVGSPAVSIPVRGNTADQPRLHVHIHGGAWRDPGLTATSIEPIVAHAFAAGAGPIAAIASINYSISPFPSHPKAPYNPIQGGHHDDARSAAHPRHVGDVLAALTFLRSFGLDDQSYVLSGHSCGAALAFQAVLAGPVHFGLNEGLEPPCPAAILGLNGLYDFPALVDGLDVTHAHLKTDYDELLSLAFGSKSRWPSASPALLDVSLIADRVRRGRSPSLILLDQSPDDQLVPINQRERFEAKLLQVAALRIVIGKRCKGQHADPWERGDMLWHSVQDALALLP